MAATLIKKYSNRRLYDTGDSRYITLDELAQKIRAGTDVRVVDAKSGDDLTQATLVQILLEGDQARLLPAHLLMQMVRLGDDGLAEFFTGYVGSALDMYMQARRGMQSVARVNPLASLPLHAGDALARLWMASPFGRAAGFGYPPPAGQGYGDGYSPGYPPAGPPIDAPTDEEADVTDESSPSRDELAELRREIDELKRSVKESSSSQKSRRSSPKKRRKRND